MKKMKLFGLAAVTIMLICCLGFLGCDNGSSGDDDPPAAAWTVTVKGGGYLHELPGNPTTGVFGKGNMVGIKAGNAPADKEFIGWTITAGVQIRPNENSPNAVFTMPEKDVVVEAEWGTLHTVSIKDGATTTPLATKYGEGRTVTITYTGTPAAGQAFKNWKVDSPAAGVTLDNANAPSTTFRMPDADVVISVEYGTAYTVTVTGGYVGATGTSNTGSFAQGVPVTIRAGTLTSGQYFEEWEVTAGTVTLADKNATTTTFSMPASAVTISVKTFALTDYLMFTTEVWLGPEDFKPNALLWEDNGLLALGKGKKEAAVWVLKVRETGLTLDADTAKSKQFAIMNKKSGNYINAKNADRVRFDSAASSGIQVKVSAFQNNDDFWWKISGRDSFPGNGFNFYKGNDSTQYAMLSFLGNSWVPSGTHSSDDLIAAVFLVHADNVDTWEQWKAFDGTYKEDSNRADWTMFTNVFDGQKYNVSASDWPLKWNVTVKESLEGDVQGPGTTTSYVNGASVTATASDRSAADYEFVNWTAEGITLANAANATATFNMPENDVTLTANYVYTGTSYFLTVVGGTIDGVTGTLNVPIEAGETVKVIRRNSRSPGMDNRTYTAKDEWDKWTSSDITIIPAKESDDEYEFEMPSKAVTITASFDSVILYSYQRGSFLPLWLGTEYGGGDKEAYRMRDDGGLLAGNQNGPDNRGNDNWYLMSKVERDMSTNGTNTNEIGKVRKFAIYNGSSGTFISRKGITPVIWDNASTGAQVKMSATFEDTDDFYWYVVANSYGGGHLDGGNNIIAVDSATNKVVGMLCQLGGTPADPEVASASGTTATFKAIHFVKLEDDTQVGWGDTWANWDVVSDDPHKMGDDEKIPGIEFNYWCHD